MKSVKMPGNSGCKDIFVISFSGEMVNSSKCARLIRNECISQVKLLIKLSFAAIWKTNLRTLDRNKFISLCG